MPKIINDLQEKILKEAKRQVFENGYTSMTIRSVAQECGIAIGTIYNYYPSKDYLTASFVLNDWIPLTEELNEKCKSTEKPMEAFHYIYMMLGNFISDYQPLFQENGAVKSVSITFHSRHCELRGQLAEMIHGICMEKAKSPSQFLPEFIAESLLTWSAEQRSFEELRTVLNHLFY
jgi:AcrR family transcriptional regulator